MKRLSLSPVKAYIALFFILISLYLIMSFRFGLNLPNGAKTQDPFLLAGTVLASLGLLYAAIQSAGEKWFIHVSWLLFAIAFFVDNLASFLEFAFAPSILDDFPAFLFMVSYTLIAVGIGLLPSSPRPVAPRSRNFLDTSIFISITLLATWVFLIIPYFFLGSPFYDQSFTALTYVLVFAAFDLLIRRRKTPNQTVSTLISLSVAVTVIGQILIAVQRSESAIWLNVLMNICWLVSYAAMGTAGVLLEFKHVKDDLEKKLEEKTAGIQNAFLLPAVWIGLLYLLLVWSHYFPETLSFSIVAVGVGTLLVVLLIRFNEALKENARLISEANRELISRRDLTEKFWHDSRHDSLTSLPNRSFLTDQLQKQIDITNELWVVNSALLFLDLDRFKPVNDRFGHNAGDQLLKAVAERLVFCVRPDDFVARLGGDEFAMILTNLQTSKSVYKVAARIMEKMTEPFEIEGIPMISGVSFGICFIEPGEKSPEDIMKDADKAMYRAKRKGRGRYETSNPIEF